MSEEYINILEELSKKESTSLALNLMEITSENLIKDKEIDRLNNIIKEVREFVEKRKDTQMYFKGTFKDNGIDRKFLIEQYDDILEILNKV